MAFFRGRGRWREDWLGEFRNARDDNYAGNFRDLHRQPVCFFCRPSQRDAENLKIRTQSDSPRFYPIEALAQGSTVGAIVGGVARVESEVGRNLESLTEDLKDNFKKMARYMFPDSTKILNPSSERYYR